MKTAYDYTMEFISVLAEIDAKVAERKEAIKAAADEAAAKIKEATERAEATVENEGVNNEDADAEYKANTDEASEEDKEIE